VHIPACSYFDLAGSINLGKKFSVGLGVSNIADKVPPTAMHLRDPGLSQLKTDPLLDPLRTEPRFQAIERELKFPR